MRMGRAAAILSIVPLAVLVTPAAVAAPENDDRADARPIEGLPFEGSQGTAGAGTSADEPRPCGQIESTVWFSFTPAASRTLAAGTDGSDYDTVLAVYEDGSDEAIVCNDDADGLQGAVHFDAAAGTTYEIQVGGHRAETGQLALRLDVAPPPGPEPPFTARPEDADIRPGVQLYVEEHGWCTSNFLFRGTGPQQGRVYIGTAGHCVGADVGATVHAPPDLGYATDEVGEAIGRVAYSSFKELPPNTLHRPDFALIEIADPFGQSLNPALLGYGGPAGIVPFEEVAVADRVLTYGNTPLRPGPGALDAREGYVSGTETPHTITMYTVTPGLPGDSGSAVLSGDGRAVGVLTTGYVVPPGQNGAVSLAKVLALAASGGWDVELGTWGVLDPGLLPSLGGS